MKKIYSNFITGLLLSTLTISVNAQNVYNNNLRQTFIEHKASIYTINIRTFGAVDKNGDEIIDVNIGEENGSFLNAIPRLDELKELGINTIYLLPITKTGKLKALGTAGSLYAMDSFNKINPQLDDLNNPLDVKNEAKIFVEEAHKKGFSVIIDLPSCASYDMTLEKPTLFLRGKDGQAITPSDWTDVRQFKVTEDNKVNEELLDQYKSFVDMTKELNIDGIRADVAPIKPKAFWSELISYARSGNPQMLFIAEASPAWSNPLKTSGYLSINDLLDSGFDGYYGEYMNFLENEKAKDFIKTIKRENKILKKFNNKKATLATFATHDQLSPMINNDTSYSKMIIWLSTTLPVNSYYLDGFPTGDNYIYGYENKKANSSSTDDDYYFVHRGKFDIFNQSRRPGGKYPEIKEEMKHSARFKNYSMSILQNGSMKFLHTNNKYVLSYQRKYLNDMIIVACNINFKEKQDVVVKIPHLSKKANITPVKNNDSMKARKNKMCLTLAPGETVVYIISQNK